MSSSVIDQITGVAQRLLEPASDAATHEQARSMFVRDPKLALHSAPIDVARGLYTERGWVLCPTYGKALRHATPDERAAGDATGGWIADGAPQLKLELERNNVVVLEIPSELYYGHTPISCAPWDGLVADGARSCPAFASADGTTVFTLWRGPSADAGAPVPERRRFVLDVSSGTDFARIRPHSDRAGRNVVPLPHGGGPLERWINMGEGFALWPAELQAALVASNESVAGHPDAIAVWIKDHYKPAKGGAYTNRAAVYEAFLTANGLTPSDLDETAFSAGCGDVPRKRAAEGYRWQLERNGKALSSVRGVLCETISAAELSQFREWRATRELSPARRKERTEQQAAVRRRVEEESDILRRFGSRDTLNRLQEIGYFQYHLEAEARRAKSSGQYGEKHIPLGLGSPLGMFDQPGTRYAAADWWAGIKLDDPPAVYRAIVQRVVEGAKS